MSEDDTPVERPVPGRPPHPAVLLHLQKLATDASDLHALVSTAAMAVANGRSGWSQREAQELESAIRGRCRNILQLAAGIPAE